MTPCPRCQKELPKESSTCPACGALIDDAPTRVLDSRAERAKSTSSSRPSFDSIDDARFVPGTILADRYRIVGLLGRGGMGEVYRADDLKLGQPVALKFLPDHLKSDGAALARFHREVRVARQVSHRNVCRVYDIGEAESHLFLSMEFIKGEELSSLLRRIGRLPADKATQISRQLCAGLAAAHDNDVLHRDLKPANVMIDENGNVRVTDFGLAGVAKEFSADEASAGTPAYMSPEQLAGKELTVTSDIYSLGLVLYELFTGKKAFEAATLNDLIKLRRSDATPTQPTSIVKDLDPLVERVIERCLQKDPSLRPTSALQVAAALPGGDPIAAALAAGETPSPEMVAAAPKEGVLKPAIAAVLLLTMLAGLALSCWLTKYTAVYRMTQLDVPPEALRARARDMIKKIGYTAPPLDSADGIILKEEYLNYIAALDQSPARWNKLRTEGPGPYRFWYRQSPRYFDTIERINVDKPALDVSGMTAVYLDMEGRLHWFTGVPPQRDPPAVAAATPDWSLPFREADLDMNKFQPVASTWVPLHAYDARAAWDGADPAHPENKVHVEAAAFRGKLTYFETVYPWDPPLRQEETQESGSSRALTFLLIAIFLVILTGSALLARKNVRLGRGDRRGAARIAVFYLIIQMPVWFFGQHHNGLPGREFTLFFLHLSDAVFTAFFLWLLYVALEPYVRRRWPHWIISWSRLLAGGYRDPLVGRDILIGATFGVGIMLLTILVDVSPQLLGRSAQIHIHPGVTKIGHMFFERFAVQITAGLFQPFFALFLLLLFVIVLRRDRLGLLALWLIITAFNALVTQKPLAMLPLASLAALLFVLVLYRYGLLATISALFVTHLLIFYPLTTELTAWYATDFVIGLVFCVALASYGFYISLAGQSLFAGRFMED